MTSNSSPNASLSTPSMSPPEDSAATPRATDGSVEENLPCNICGGPCATEGEFECLECGSIERWRAVIHALSLGLFGEPLALNDFPVSPEIKGIGLSDVLHYAQRLPAKLGYQNTFFDERTPHLDITDPPKLELDFVISSDVFEHISPPVQRAFDGCYRILKPGGILVLTVPYYPETVEHFPNLDRFRVVEFEGKQILVNRTKRGDWEVFDRLRFHGGRGVTLEMRRFGKSDVIQHLRTAGFSEVIDYQKRFPQFTRSRPFIARKP